MDEKIDKFILLTLNLKSSDKFSIVIGSKEVFVDTISLVLVKCCIFYAYKDKEFVKDGKILSTCM